jgi:hypothetical protein
MSAKVEGICEYLQKNNPKELDALGLNERKVGQLVFALIHLASQKGRSSEEFDHFLLGPAHFSPREAKALHYRLRKDHGLELVGFQYVSRWRKNQSSSEKNNKKKIS